MIRRLVRTRTDEHGYATIFALCFLTFVGLVGTATLGQLQTNTSASRSLRRIEDRTTAVEAGVNAAIQIIRKAPTCGPNNAATDLGSIDLGGHNIELSCASTTTSSASTTDNWAIFQTGLVTGSPAGIATANCANCAKPVTGAVYNESAAWSLQSGLTVTGEIVQRSTGPCANPNPARLQTTFPFSFRCIGTSLPVPTAPQSLPARAGVLPVLSLPVDTAAGGCKIFWPGSYNGPALKPTFQQRNQGRGNYLRSGVYVFNNVGDIVIQTNADVVGGKGPATAFPIPASCTTERNGEPALNGPGVLIVLAGNSRIVLASNARADFAPWTPVGGTGSGVSIRQLVDTDPADWRAPVTGFLVSTATTIGAPILQDGAGANGALSIGGAVHVPKGAVALDATNQSFSKLSGGAVVGQISIGASASVNSSAPFVTGGPASGASNSYVVSAVSVEPGGKRITATAEVSLAADIVRTPTIISWIITEAPNP